MPDSTFYCIIKINLALLVVEAQSPFPTLQIAGGCFGKRVRGGWEVNRHQITRGEEHDNTEPTFRHTVIDVVIFPFSIMSGMKKMNEDPARCSQYWCVCLSKKVPAPLIHISL